MSFRDLQRLRTFTLVLDLGSISAAATVLGYTQSAVSQQVATLEAFARNTSSNRPRTWRSVPVKRCGRRAGVVAGG